MGISNPGTASLVWAVIYDPTKTGRLLRNTTYEYNDLPRNFSSVQLSGEPLIRSAVLEPTPVPSSRKNQERSSLNISECVQNLKGLSGRFG